MVELKKALEEAKARNSVLETEKALVEAKLDKTQDDVLVMLSESFNHAVRQAYLFYNGPPTVSAFDATKNVYEGQLVPIDELEALKNALSRTLKIKIVRFSRYRFFFPPARVWPSFLLFLRCRGVASFYFFNQYIDHSSLFLFYIMYKL